MKQQARDAGSHVRCLKGKLEPMRGARFAFDAI